MQIITEINRRDATGQYKRTIPLEAVQQQCGGTVTLKYDRPENESSEGEKTKKLKKIDPSKSKN